MQIMTTDAKNGSDLAIEAAQILWIRRPSGDNNALIMETHITTALMGPNGPLAFAVKESVDEIARRVNYARSIKPGDPYDASLLGFKSN